MPTNLELVRVDQGSRFLANLLLVSLIATVLAPSARSGDVDFNRDVRPILSDRCFHCHGPDADNQDSTFRIDNQENAFADLGGYVGIIPGEPDESELVLRIESEDPDAVMPPPDSPRQLSDKDKRILRRWVQQGAVFDQHWAFKQPVQAAVPAERNAIDFFVRSKLEGTSLAPSPLASKRQLLRRVTLDLIGLPPRPEEVEAFLADSRDDSYERVVDRLLSTSAYGERMAQVWLDTSRYADSAGYQNDFKRSQWPWRDWVIDAYNQNMPFDEFSIHQLAGDLLPDATDSMRLATAFNRNHRINNEGGIIPDEFLVEYVADRVETTSTTWLGLTTGCARCHDHKYDPISMKDFYRFFAFFHNVPEKGKDGAIAPEPNMDVYTGGTKKEHQSLLSKVARLEEQESGYAEEHAQALEEWMKEKQDERSDASSLPEPIAHYPFDFPNKNTFANLARPKLPARIQGREKNVVSEPNGKFGPSVNFGSAGHIRLGKVFGDEGIVSTSPASWSFFIKPKKNAIGSVLSCRTEEADRRGYQVSLVEIEQSEKLGIEFQLIADEEKNERLSVKTLGLLKAPADEFTHITITYDGSGAANGVAIYLDGLPFEIETTTDSLPAERFQIDQDHLFGSGMSFAAIDELYIHASCLSKEDVQSLSKIDSKTVLLKSPKRSKAQDDFLKKSYFHSEDAGYQKIVKQLERQRKQVAKFENANLTKVSVMEEMSEPRQTHLLQRGDYTQPDKSEVLLPATIASLPQMSDGLPKNRLGLAKWLFQPNHPLTARVAVNRYWQMLFGAGLVKTPEDFGSQGAQPTHPKLLDWLAVEFRESGWDIKGIIKRIVMSETYCQDSRVTAEMIELDPANERLARGPRFRLSAFAIRDQALAVSGLLSKKQGGPPVMPYQPEGLWDEVNAKGFKYIVAKDDGLYRRSLYSFWRRTVPPPSMMNFDSAGREACSVNVSRTNTPLQAINLQNDPQYVEAARALGQRMMTEAAATTDARITYCSQLVLGRAPSPMRHQLWKAFRWIPSSPNWANRMTTKTLLTLSGSISLASNC